MHLLRLRGVAARGVPCEARSCRARARACLLEPVPFRGLSCPRCPAQARGRSRRLWRPPNIDATMELVRDSVERVQRATGAEGINVGLNLGRAAGAGIADHLHAHVVPRWTGDTNFMPVVSDTRVMPEHLDASWQRLLPFFADVSGEHPARALVFPPVERTPSVGAPVPFPTPLAQAAVPLDQRRPCRRRDGLGARGDAAVRSGGRHRLRAHAARRRARAPECVARAGGHRSSMRSFSARSADSAGRSRPASRLSFATCVESYRTSPTRRGTGGSPRSPIGCRPSDSPRRSQRSRSPPSRFRRAPSSLVVRRTVR